MHSTSISLKWVPRLAEKISQPVNTMTRNHFPHINDSIALSTTDPVEIKNIVSSIKNSSACGIDGIPISVIKSVSKSISPILSSQ